MSKQIEAYSFALGVCEAFCEVVRAGVKRIALSHRSQKTNFKTHSAQIFSPRVKQSPESTAAKRII